MSEHHKTHDIASLAAEIALAKHEVIRNRRAAKLKAAADNPRDVYLNACERIANALGPDYKFAKSGPRATRQDGSLRFGIHFQSDRYNVAGQYVGLAIHAGVESREAEKSLGRSAWPFQFTSDLGAAQIGNLQKPYRWWKWDLASPETRDERIGDAISQIRALILPFFERFSDLRSLAELLTDSEIPGIDSEQAVRLCYWQLGNSAAEKCIGFWMRNYASGLTAFRRERDRVFAGGQPVEVWGNPVVRLGAIAGALGIAREI